MKAAVIPTPGLGNLIASKPDAYGPLWLAITVCILHSVCRQMADYLRHDPTELDDTLKSILPAFMTSFAYIGVNIGIGCWLAKPGLIVCLNGYTQLTIWPALVT